MIYMLHGAAGSTADWDEFMPLLGVSGVKAVDIYANEATGLDAFALALNEMTSPGDVLIGYSMGGRLALHALLNQGHKWSKAVIISAHTGIPEPEDRERRVNADGVWAQLILKDWGDFVDQWMKQSVFGGRKMSWDRSKPVAPVDRVQRCFTCWSLGKQKNLIDELVTVNAPVLWISGEEDKKYSEIAKAASSRMPNCDLAIIPGAGHRCPWEEPELTAGVIRGFLSP